MTSGNQQVQFEELRDRALHAAQIGRFEEAEELSNQALAWAHEHGTATTVDHAICNRASVLVEVGRSAGELPRLREILVRNSDPVSCRMAAYNIARHYQLTKDFKKAQFYARIARDRSEIVGRSDWMASSHNLLGNIFLSESFVDEACSEYEKALRFMSDEPNLALAGIHLNIGYCRVLQGRHAEGYRILYGAMAMTRRFGGKRYELLIRLYLCFAHLETGRYRYAERHGKAAFALADSLGDIGALKNALYLLGETANLSGDTATARGYFTRLQKEFFADASYLPEFLLAVDIRKLVNLYA